jgi:hypothetical protein
MMWAPGGGQRWARERREGRVLMMRGSGGRAAAGWVLMTLWRCNFPV